MTILKTGTFGGARRKLIQNRNNSSSPLKTLPSKFREKTMPENPKYSSVIFTLVLWIYKIL